MSASEATSGDWTETSEEPRRLRRWLTNFFRRRVSNEAEVDDLVQEVFVRIVRRSSRERIDNLAAYVLRTALSVLSDQSRKSRVRFWSNHIAFEPDVHALDEDMTPERLLSARQELTSATAALLSLPERTRTIFVLRRVDEMPMRDIAQQLGISISSVEKHMVRAVRHLSQEMDQRHAS